MNLKNIDLIGDIHGHADPLHRLLAKLGYKKKPSGTWSHPDNRIVVFLGDYIDRGPKIRETLHTVRSMCDAGDARAIMGNHEHNAICMVTFDNEGKPLRDHNDKNFKQASATREQFVGKHDEWTSHIEWFKTLPFAIDLGEVRAVHACWDPTSIQALKGKSLTDPEILQVSRKKSSPIGAAILRLLNGPELHLPDGMTYPDKEGTMRNQVRVRWWDMKLGMTLGECVFPKPDPTITKPIERRHINQIDLCPEDAPLTCFGHYWLPPTESPLIKPNLACLDLSIAKDGKLACLRMSETKEKPEIVTENGQRDQEKARGFSTPSPSFP